jgi:hypothetical protein
VEFPHKLPDVLRQPPRQRDRPVKIRRTKRPRRRIPPKIPLRMPRRVGRDRRSTGILARLGCLRWTDMPPPRPTSPGTAPKPTTATPQYAATATSQARPYLPFRLVVYQSLHLSKGRYLYPPPASSYPSVPLTTMDDTSWFRN